MGVSGGGTQLTHLEKESILGFANVQVELGGTGFRCRVQGVTSSPGQLPGQGGANLQIFCSPE